MHTSILRQVMAFILQFFDMELPWDNFTWTIWSYIVFCFITFVIAYVLWYIVKHFWQPLKE